jgi:branched-chain amino acid transport system ATP-binding protein/urea transport system ATP-binding protein
MLTLRGVSSGYGGTRILYDLDLTLSQGEMLAILGRNGVGKTTIVRTVIGSVPTWAGHIEFKGREISGLAPHERCRRGIAYVPQGRDIFGALTVEDNLLVAAYGTGQRNPKALLKTMYEEFPVLAEKGKLKGASLSGGQQQILALARAMMMNPDLLLLDEPTEGIQPSIVDQIADTVRRINKTRGITVVVVEQNLDFVSELAARANIIDHGQVVRDLPMQEVVRSKDIQQQYLGV